MNGTVTFYYNNCEVKSKYCTNKKKINAFISSCTEDAKKLKGPKYFQFTPSLTIFDTSDKSILFDLKRINQLKNKRGPKVKPKAKLQDPPCLLNEA